MKSLKFRAWDGSEMHPLFSINSQTGKVVYNGEVKDWPVMQSTGLTDVNGTEIYEGDIVTADNLTCVVEWGRYGWIAKWKRQRRSSFDYGSPDLGFRAHKIIGNIHENPELLEKTA